MLDAKAANVPILIPLKHNGAKTALLRSSIGVVSSIKDKVRFAWFTLRLDGQRRHALRLHPGGTF